MMSELKTDIIKEVQQSISAQIKELALTLIIQVNNSIKEGLSLRPATNSDHNIETEVDTDSDPITQESQPTNEDITDMDLEVETQKKHIERTTLTAFILADDNIPFGDRIQNKEQRLIRLLLQKPNGLKLKAKHQLINREVFIKG